MASESLKSDNQLRTVVVTSAEQLAHAYCIRSICFVEERGFTFAQEFDGNDFNATHFVMYAGEEPIGTSRVRWFGDFAKIERTAFRKAYRSPRILKTYALSVFGHIAQKGYGRVVTIAEAEYATMWERLLGFERGRELRKSGRDAAYFELVKTLAPAADAITERTAPSVMFRIEGSWDVPSTFG